jgi:uncharacterized membrane protein
VTLTGWDVAAATGIIGRFGALFSYLFGTVIGALTINLVAGLVG